MEKNETDVHGHEAESQYNIQLITFKLSDRVLGVDIQDVKEVCDNIQITPVNHAEERICGYMNIRGQILLVVDLKHEFGFKPTPIVPSSKVVVFKDTVDEPFGILVDGVSDVVDIDEEQIKDRRADTGDVDTAVMEKRVAKPNICKGVYALEDSLVLILNSRNVLPKEKQLESLSIGGTNEK